MEKQAQKPRENRDSGRRQKQRKKGDKSPAKKSAPNPLKAKSKKHEVKEERRERSSSQPPVPVLQMSPPPSPSTTVFTSSPTSTKKDKLDRMGSIAAFFDPVNRLADTKRRTRSVGDLVNVNQDISLTLPQAPAIAEDVDFDIEPVTGKHREEETELVRKINEKRYETRKRRKQITHLKIQMELKKQETAWRENLRASDQDSSSSASPRRARNNTIRALEQFSRDLQSKIQSEERGSERSAVLLAEEEAKDVSLRLQGINQEVVAMEAELKEVRNHWIAEFGDTEFDVRKMAERFFDSEQEIEKMEHTLNERYKEVESYRVQSDVDIDKSVEEYQDRLVADEKELRRLSSVREEALKENEAQQIALDTAIERQETLRSEIQDIKNRVVNQKKDVDALESVVAASLESKQIVNEAIIDKQSACEGLRKEIENIVANQRETEAKMQQMYNDLQITKEEREHIETLQVSLKEHQDASIQELRTLALERAEARTLAMRECESERRELQSMLDIFGAQSHQQQEKLDEMLKKLQTYIGSEAHTSLQDTVKAIKSQHAKQLEPLLANISKLRKQLEHCVASHSVHNQTIKENRMVIDHLQKQCNDLMEYYMQIELDYGPNSSMVSRDSAFSRETTITQNPPEPQPVEPQLAALISKVVDQDKTRIRELTRTETRLQLSIQVLRSRLERVQEFTMQQALRTWLPDSKCDCCLSCKQEFSFFFRRHHCRICGGVFCNDCSDNRVQTAGAWRPVRSCDGCTDIIYKMSFDDEEEEEFPNEPLPSRPVLDWSCYVCGNKKSARVAQKCYSPSCLANRKYSEEEERKRFEAAVLGMREVLGTQEYSPEQLFTYAKENKITEERWASFLADAFTNGVPSLSEVTTTRL
eukprot:m.57587 g.57587  ORF g.57587 m.57587 type:complete len:876 (+) comp11118_c0_seq2:139-2766(+)